MPVDLPAVARDLAPTGSLRASINLGNPVLAQGTSSTPSGVTVDLAREIASRLDVPVAFVCFDAARRSFQALTSGDADLCFLAIEPARAAEVDFTAAYVLIEGVYAVPDDSPIAAIADVDRPGVRIGVKDGSAYDLYLTRSLEHATVVRGAEGVEVFAEQGLEVGAGIRQPLTDFVSSRPGLRVIDEAFMQIRQAVAIRKGHDPATLAWLHETVEELKESGFVGDALARSGRGDTTVAPRD